MAVALYQLQHGPLLAARPPTYFTQPAAATGSTTSASIAAGAAAAGGQGGSGGSRVGAVENTNRSSSSSGVGYWGNVEELLSAWQLQVHELLGASPSAAVRLAAPVLYVYEPATAGFHKVLPVDLAVSSSSLVVLDAGALLVVYAGRVLYHDGVGASSAAPAEANGGGAAAAGVAASGYGGMGVGVGGMGPPDMAMVAAPAVQHAQQLAAGRFPVPKVHVVENEEGLMMMLGMLVPLHVDPIQVQMLLLPQLKQMQPAEHGLLVDWHRKLAAARQAAAGGRAGVVDGRGRVVQQQQPSFGQWCGALRVGLPVDHELAAMADD